MFGGIFVIQNLTKMNFREFGTIMPERKGETVVSEKNGASQTLYLTGGAVPVYRPDADCWIFGGGSAAVLSVSTDGVEFKHFHMDKTVCIRAGVFFCLTALEESVTLEAACADTLSAVDHRKSGQDYLLRPGSRIEGVYSLFYQEKERGFFFPGESHPMLELTYVDEGTLHSVADGTDLLLSQGEMVLYAPDQWHMQYADIGVAPCFVTISFYVSGSMPEELFGRKLKASQYAVSLIRQILQEQEKAACQSEDMIQALLWQLLILLRREAQEVPRKLKADYSVHNENEIIRRAQQYIGTHVREKLSVPLVAKQVDVSPSYLTALFHKHLQLAPGEYIRRIKLQESKRMIRQNNLNFTEIADALQYSTVHHFSRQFKEKFGMTPTEYAKSVR